MGSLGLVITLALLLIYKGEGTETRQAELTSEGTGNDEIHSVKRKTCGAIA